MPHKQHAVIGIVLAAFVFAAISGCMSLPDQKLSDGESGCTTVSSVYGSVSTVRTRTDNPGKGGGHGKSRITCGSAVMEIDSTVGALPTR